MMQTFTLQSKEVKFLSHLFMLFRMVIIFFLIYFYIKACFPQIEQIDDDSNNYGIISHPLYLK